MRNGQWQIKTFSGLHEIGSLTGQEYEDICRQNTDHVYIGNDTIICKVLSRFKMYVDSTDMGITPHLVMDGYWESWLTQLFARIIKPGYVCLDIGANFGYYSILMSELSGANGKTVSVEPNPRICELLKATAFVNGNKFKVAQGAVSDRRGEAVLTVNDRELGGGTIKPNEQAPGRKQVTVDTFSVDDLVNDYDLERVDVVKIDVEGMEPVALKGMEKTIEQNPSIQIVIEYSPSIYTEPGKFTEFLFDKFSVYRVNGAAAMEKLTSSVIPSLLAITDHTDLYLQRR